jgi:hypothetical protein
MAFSLFSRQPAAGNRGLSPVFEKTWSVPGYRFQPFSATTAKKS